MHSTQPAGPLQGFVESPRMPDSHTPLNFPHSAPATQDWSALAATSYKRGCLWEAFPTLLMWLLPCRVLTCFLSSLCSGIMPLVFGIGLKLVSRLVL